MEVILTNYLSFIAYFIKHCNFESCYFYICNNGKVT